MNTLTLHHMVPPPQYGGWGVLPPQYGGRGVA